MATYVTSTGFDKKTADEIKTELEQDYQDVFGTDIDLDPDQPFGQMIGISSNREANLWDALQEIYTARNPQEAVGTSLDNIAAESGSIRKAATATQVDDVILYGDDGTIVLAGKLAKQPSASVEYALEATVTIQITTARYGLIEVGTILDSTLYTITIDAVPYTFTSDASATALEILTGLKADIDGGAFAGTTTLDSVNETLAIQDLDTDFNFFVDANLNIDQVGSAGEFTCTTTSANPLPADSLTEIVTSVTGWDSINNPSAGITGLDVETDDAFRLRREQSVNGIGNATEDSIRAKLLDEVDNVSAVTIYSNRTSATDSESRPPKSFEAVVQGGTDQDVADKIWETQPAGIESYGNTSVNVTDSQSFTQVVKFSRPEDVYIFVRVKRDLYSEEEYPTDGDTLIKEAIVAWSLEVANINVGKDVIRQRLSEPVYTVPGIEDILIELDSSTSLPHTPSYTAANVVIDARQLAVFADTRIVVEDLTP